MKKQKQSDKSAKRVFSIRELDDRIKEYLPRRNYQFIDGETALGKMNDLGDEIIVGDTLEKITENQEGYQQWQLILNDDLLKTIILIEDYDGKYDNDGILICDDARDRGRKLSY
jgi:hypothetical protein